MRRVKIAWEAEPVYRSGREDDLLTGGLGLEGLRNPVLPEGAAPRMAVLHKDFRDLVDISPGGHFLRSLGVDANSLRVPGTEHSVLLRLRGLSQPFAVRLLMPDHFDWDRPLIVVAPSSGSRGVTGAIGDIGSWALPNGCALVLTDKGTGGVELLSDGTCYGPDFEPTTDPKTPSIFRLRQDMRLERFRSSHPEAIALKHAHSENNIEAYWPDIVLAAARYGRETLQRHHGQARSLKTLNAVKVVAAGVSNGGGAVLRAAERDKTGLLDAVVAVEPNVSINSSKECHVSIGDDMVAFQPRHFIDYATQMNVLLPAALLAPELNGLPFQEVTAKRETEQADWGISLKEKGLLEGRSVPHRATDALRKIRDLGFSRDTEALTHTMSMAHIWPAVCHTFINALGRFPVSADPIGAHVRFAATDQLGQRLSSLDEPTAPQRRNFGALSGGLSPGGGAFTIYRNGDIHPDIEDALTFSGLASSAQGKRVAKGAKEVLASGKSRGHPTIILHGRCDSLINVNHTSRAYFSAAKSSQTDTRNWRYYEHATGQHFESFLMIPGLSERFNPLQPAVFQALDLMLQHLFHGGELPPSQVIDERLPSEIGTDGLAIRPGAPATIQTENIEHPIQLNNGVLSIPLPPE